MIVQSASSGLVETGWRSAADQMVPVSADVIISSCCGVDVAGLPVFLCVSKILR